MGQLLILDGKAITVNLGTQKKQGVGEQEKHQDQ